MPGPDEYASVVPSASAPPPSSGSREASEGLLRATRSFVDVDSSAAPGGSGPGSSRRNSIVPEKFVEESRGPRPGEEPDPKEVADTYHKLKRQSTEKMFGKEDEDLHPLYLNIDSPWRRRWDVGQAFILLYTCIMVPIRVGYGVQPAVMFYVDLGIDVYFTVDVYLNFVTGYEDEDGDIVTDMKMISTHYLKTWFMLDILAILPIEMVLDALSDQLVCQFTMSKCDDNGSSTATNSADMLKMFKVLRLLRLVKLLRLMRLSRLLDRYDDDLFLIKPLISIFKLVFVLLFLGHLFGCFFYFFSSEEWRDGNEIALIDEGIMTSWIKTEFGGGETSMEPIPGEGCPAVYVFDPTVDGTKKCISPFTLADRYIASMYWAFTTMTTVGYGDISATTKSERVFAILGMIVGGFVFSAIIGNMGTMLRKLESHRRAYNEKMESVSVFLRDITLPAQLRNKVLMFFRKQEVKSYDPKAILLELPFELRSGVLLSLYREIIEKLPFLRKDNEMFVTDVCSRLQPYTCAARTFVFQRGELGGEMYIIFRGEVEILDLDRQTVLFKMGTGEFFGEANVVRVITGQVAITSKPKRTENVRARSTAQLLVLSLADLLELTRTYPDMASNLYSAYKDKKHRTGLSRQSTLAKSAISGLTRSISQMGVGGSRVNLHGGRPSQNQSRVGLQMLQTFAKFRRIVRERQDEIVDVLATYREAVAAEVDKLPPGFVGGVQVGHGIQRRNSLGSRFKSGMSGNGSPWAAALNVSQNSTSRSPSLHEKELLLRMHRKVVQLEEAVKGIKANHDAVEARVREAREAAAASSRGGALARASRDDVERYAKRIAEALRAREGGGGGGAAGAAAAAAAAGAATMAAAAGAAGSSVSFREDEEGSEHLTREEALPSASAEEAGAGGDGAGGGSDSGSPARDEVDVDDLLQEGSYRASLAGGGPGEEEGAAGGGLGAGEPSTASLFGAPVDAAVDDLVDDVLALDSGAEPPSVPGAPAVSPDGGGGSASSSAGAHAEEVAGGGGGDAEGGGFVEGERGAGGGSSAGEEAGQQAEAAGAAAEGEGGGGGDDAPAPPSVPAPPSAPREGGPRPSPALVAFEGEGGSPPRPEPVVEGSEPAAAAGGGEGGPFSAEAP